MASKKAKHEAAKTRRAIAAKAKGKPSKVQDAADPRFVPVVAALQRASGFSLMESKSGAMRGLVLHGKSFGMSSHGRFILRLGEARVAELIAQGVGVPFEARPGTAMKGWIVVTQAGADWVTLAREALATMADTRRARRT